MDDKTLISAAIQASGLSVRRFAADVLIRDWRTVYRWLNGSNPLPHMVRAKCQAIVDLHTPEDTNGTSPNS